MRISKTAALAAAAALVIGPLAGSASAHSHKDHGDIPPHPHVRLLHATFTEDPFSLRYSKCVDLAGGKILPLHAHHAHLHFGRAGEAQRRAGHLVVPLAPFLPVPIHNCADLAEFFPPTPR